LEQTKQKGTTHSELFATPVNLRTPIALGKPPVFGISSVRRNASVRRAPERVGNDLVRRKKANPC
jgi:hypothetical protein